MNSRKVSVIITASLLFLVGCANPQLTQYRKEFTPTNWRTVAILPFSGDARFTATAADTFTIRLLGPKNLHVIQPSQTEISVKRLGIVPTPNGYGIGEVQRIAKEIDADVVIMGVVSSYNNGMTMNGFCTAKVIDAASGEIIAASYHPSGLLFGYSEHQGVIAATERTAKEILKILNELEAKNQRSPTKTTTKTEKSI